MQLCFYVYYVYPTIFSCLSCLYATREISCECSSLIFAVRLKLFYFHRFYGVLDF